MVGVMGLAPILQYSDISNLNSELEDEACA